MGYFLIEDFSGGIDRRKLMVSAKPGTLRTLQNAFINVGGEIEKRKTVTTVGTFPAGTHGLGFHDQELVTFGTVSANTLDPLPSYTGYRQLIVNDGKTITRILRAVPYADKLYVIARFSDGSRRHFLVDGDTGALVEGVSGVTAITHGAKVYSADGRNLLFTGVDEPSGYDPEQDTGAGIIDVTTQSADITQIIGLGVYYSYLAVLAGNAVQLWEMDPDPENNYLVQTLGNIGLAAPNGLAQFGNGDLLFLSHTGVRSLRARDASNSAALNDIGAPIDSLIAEKRAALTSDDAEKIMALVDPLSGNFWLLWGNDVFVLSDFPNSKISAWSVYRLNVPVDYAMVANSRIAIRSGDGLYIYGSVPPTGSPWALNAPTGSAASNYDASQVTAELPFVDIGKPAHVKNWQGLDLAAEGTWIVDVCPSLEFPDTWTTIATVTGSSYGQGQIPINMSSTHLRVRLRSMGSGPAKVSSIALHFEGGDSD